MRVSTKALAQAIEEEWMGEKKEKLLTALATTALDKVSEDRDGYITHCCEVLSKDTLLFWEESLGALVKLQEDRWQPCIDKVNQRLGLHLKPTFSLSITPLSTEEEKKVKRFLSTQTDCALAGFTHLLHLTESFSLTFLVFNDPLPPEEAWNLANLHENYQRLTWGKDEEAFEKKGDRYQEFLETVRFLKLGKLNM